MHANMSRGQSMYGVCEEETSGTIIRVKDSVSKDHRLIARGLVRGEEKACGEDEITATFFSKSESGMHIVSHTSG